MAFVSRDLMVNVLYGMAGENDKHGCTPSPPDCTPSPDQGCTPSPGQGCTPSPPNPNKGHCTPSPGPTTGDEGYKARPPRQGLASLRQQLRETLAQA